MNKITLVSFVSLCGLMSCTSTHSKQVETTYEKPAVIQTQPTKADYQLAYGNNPQIQHAYEQYLKTGKAPNIITSGFVQFAYGASQPVINASPFELTVVTLEKAENVTNVSSGDPMRWSYSLAYSGIDKDKQAHIMVKPSQPGISTDMIITTNKRMYTLKIVSTDDGKYLRNVKFWYPNEIQQYWKSYNSNPEQDIGDDPTVSQSSNIHLNKLNFSYSIDSSFFNSPQWKPSRVFDDGVHTYIQVPDAVNSSDLPALFVSDASGSNKALVNYRFKKPYFVVDKIFKKAVLILGVGSNQSKVTITNEAI